MFKIPMMCWDSSSVLPDFVEPDVCPSMSSIISQADLAMRFWR
jgi:hypothetical protein